MRDKVHTTGIIDARPVRRDFSEASDGVTGQRWYVVYTQPSSEIRAVAHLQRQGFAVFCPRYRRIVRHARKRTSARLPLFPNYLFISLDMARDRWRSVNGTRGIVRLIAQGEVPQPVPRGIVETLQAHTSADGTLDWLPSLSIGQTVRVADGPFADLAGKLERLDVAGRVSVLLEILGRSVSVSLPARALDPAA